MAKATVTRGEQKAFVKIFDSICQWNSRWDRWNDMIMLFAIEIANTVDAEHRAERNKTYAAIARKYKPQEFQVFADLFAELVNNLERNPFQDFLGSMYMELGLGNDHAGQFFTPYDVCRMMAEITVPKEFPQFERPGYITINDPACGAGATLIAAAQVLHTRGINYQQRVVFIAQDIDQTVALMCYVQMSLIGCSGYVRVGDTISDPTTGHPLYGDGTGNCWMMPMFYHQVWHMRRLVDAMKRIMQPMTSNEPEQEQAEVPAIEAAAEPEPQEKEPDQKEPVLIMTAKKKGRKVLEGQLMFDLTGGM